jgi:hypothetical protein
MSQYGTRTWDLWGKTWRWMVDHYYNANSGRDGSSSGLRTAYMTSPLEVRSAVASPSVVAPGGSFTITGTAYNYAELAHQYIIAGASLYSASAGYLNDTGNDKPISLNPGSNAFSRFFTVSASAVPGVYDLIVALWLDIDEDGRITPDVDLPMHSLTVSGGVEIRSACTYSITPTSASFGASGGSGSVSVTASAGCSWQATSNAAWITITSGSSGSGNGTVNYTVSANSSTSSRSGTLTIAGQTFTVMQPGAPGGLPDLVVTSLTAPSSGIIGGQISISVNVANQGTVAAGGFRVGFYFSTDQVITTGDTFSGWFCNFSGLAAGGSTGCAGNVGVPASLTPGVYYFGAIVDDLGAVPESNEGNNARAAVGGPITLSGAGTGPRGDFDGNGKPDLIWQHTDGSVVLWYMGGADGSLYLMSRTLAGPSAVWRVVAVADLDGNGKPDLIWQHTCPASAGNGESVQPLR